MHDRIYPLDAPAGAAEMSGWSGIWYRPTPRTPQPVAYTPAMSAEQAISKLAFAVREIERLPRDGWSEQQIERLRALVSAADGAVVKMEGEKKYG